MVRSHLYRLYWKLERAIVPSLRYSQADYEDVLGSYVGTNTRWLDVGCGRRVLPEWRRIAEQEIVTRCQSIVGIDYDLASLRSRESRSALVRGDITRLPFEDNTFDLVTANMVVEHLSDPLTQFQEIHRVMDGGGFFLFHTPNLRAYTTILARMVPELIKPLAVRFLEGRKAKDVFPTHYRANTEEGIRQLARECCFESAKVSMISSSAMFVMFPPLLIPELLWIRLLEERQSLRHLRTNMIAVFRKAKVEASTPGR